MEHTAKKQGLLRRFWPYLKKYRRILFFDLACAALTTLCDMVLPADHPLILDDALISFDDQRMEAALQYLMEVSRQRQVLLLTCQEREGRYLSRAFPGQYHTVSFSKQESKI